MAHLLRTRLRQTAALTALLALELGLLGFMDYSKAWMTRTSLSEALQPQTPWRLADLDWNPAAYAGTPKLKPLQQMVHQHCPDRSGLETAVCLSNLLAARFPHGNPKHELFDRNFDPLATLQSHLAGEPGHCVTRSAILAAALLSAGIPARMLQLAPSFQDRQDRRGGHNAIEVWDPHLGWIFFDPTFGGSVRTQAGEQSAAALLAAGGGLSWVQLSTVPATLGTEPLDGQRAYDGNPTPRFNGNLIYPEPWLYTRVGRKQAPGPFTGSFLVVGPPSLRLAVGHQLLLGTILVTALLGLLCFIGLVRTLLAGWRPQPRAAALLARDADADDAAE
jgi:hypothetical protein